LTRRKIAALVDEGGDQLRPPDLAILGVGRLLIVDQAPSTLEQLAAQQAGDQARRDAERCEEETCHRLKLVSELALTRCGSLLVKLRFGGLPPGAFGGDSGFGAPVLSFLAMMDGVVALSLCLQMGLLTSAPSPVYCRQHQDQRDHGCDDDQDDCQS